MATYERVGKAERVGDLGFIALTDNEHGTTGKRPINSLKNDG
jgi:hypothetical protein